jgi:hypothetical protein
LVSDTGCFVWKTMKHSKKTGCAPNRTHPEKSIYDSDMYNREFPSGNFLFFVVCMMSLFRCL